MTDIEQVKKILNDPGNWVNHPHAVAGNLIVDDYRLDEDKAAKEICRQDGYGELAESKVGGRLMLTEKQIKDAQQGINVQCVGAVQDYIKSLLKAQEQATRKEIGEWLEKRTISPDDYDITRFEPYAKVMESELNGLKAGKWPEEVKEE